MKNKKRNAFSVHFPQKTTLLLFCNFVIENLGYSNAKHTFIHYLTSFVLTKK